MLVSVISFKEAAQAAGCTVKPIHELDPSLPPCEDKDSVLVAVNDRTGEAQGGFNHFHDEGMSWFLEQDRGFDFDKAQDRDAFYARFLEA